MSVSGKFAFNPDAAAAQKQSGTSSRPALRKGISRVATEARWDVMPMRRAAGLSIAFHLLSPIALVVALMLLMMLLGLDIWDWLKPQHKPADMVFTLVHDTQATPPEKPLFKGNFNQRAGGKNDPTQPLKPPQDNQPSSPAKQAKTVQQKPKVAPPKPVAAQPPAIALPSEAKPLEIEDPVAESDSGAVAIGAPADISTLGATNGNAMVGTGQGGTAANAQGGGGAPGVDVIQDVDFGPFMADLEKRIKRNWLPPRGSESTKVMLLFYLARDGKVVKIETSKPSGDEEADRAAIAAVNASAPFMAFPPQVKEDILPVEFTFDYNVLNPKNSRRGLRR